ncbi:MAG: carboxypeptidase regulatory-like domain-containing protein, partial [Candidatus Altarchaeaceae archaeon]
FIVIINDGDITPNGTKYCINAYREGYISPEGLGEEVTFYRDIACQGITLNISLDVAPTIYGYVMEEDNITPISNANVCFDKDLDGTCDYITATDAAGFFKFDSPVYGYYCVNASKTGYINNGICYPDIPLFDGTFPIEVIISLAKSPELPYIGGFVFDSETHLPIVNATVYLDLNCDGSYDNSTRTNVSGAYKFINPPAGKYCVNVTADGYNPLGENLYNIFGEFDGKNNFIYNFSLTKSVRGHIFVNVTDVDGLPVENADVMIYHGTCGINLVTVLKTNASGI